jgi:hypothetical protein
MTAHVQTKDDTNILKCYCFLGLALAIIIGRVITVSAQHSNSKIPKAIKV